MNLQLERLDALTDTLKLPGIGQTRVGLPILFGTDINQRATTSKPAKTSNVYSYGGIPFSENPRGI